MRGNTINISWSSLLVFALFCTALYFPVFLHLDVLPIVLWDESLFSIRAIHYYDFGEYMENFNNYPGLPDHRNTKMPFVTWLQWLGLELIGIDELGLRLPIALLFVGTVFYTMYFGKKHFNTVHIGYLIGLIVVSSSGFIRSHMLRTGDHDVPFACFLFLALLFFYRYVRSNHWRPLAAFSCFMVAAFLTKNVMAGIIFPALLLYLIYEKSLISSLKDYRIYLSLICIVISYTGTLVVLELQYPGFIERMWNYELMGRYTQTIEGHRGPFLYYIRGFLEEWQNPFSYFVPVSIALIFDPRMKKKLRSFMVLMTFTLLTYLLVLSFSETKTYWYAAPLFLINACLISLAIHHLWNTYVSSSPQYFKTALIIGGLSITALPYSDVVQSVYFPEPIFQDDQYGNFIERVSQGHPEKKTFTLVDSGFATSALFYMKKFNSSDKGYDIRYRRTIRFRKSQLVMTCTGETIESLHKQYEYEILEDEFGCKLLKITGKKGE